MSKTQKSLSDTFDIHDQTDEPEGEPLEITHSNSNTLESDVDAVRDNLYNLLVQGADAFTHLKKIAKSEESARSYEVLNTMLGSLSDVATKIVELHEKKAKIERLKNIDQPVAINNGSVTNNNTSVFLGTTAELSKMLNQLPIDTQVIESSVKK